MNKSLSAMTLAAIIFTGCGGGGSETAVGEPAPAPAPSPTLPDDGFQRPITDKPDENPGMEPDPAPVPDPEPGPEPTPPAPSPQPPAPDRPNPEPPAPTPAPPLVDSATANLQCKYGDDPTAQNFRQITYRAGRVFSYIAGTNDGLIYPTPPDQARVDRSAGGATYSWQLVGGDPRYQGWMTINNDSQILGWGYHGAQLTDYTLCGIARDSERDVITR